MRARLLMDDAFDIFRSGPTIEMRLRPTVSYGEAMASIISCNEVTSIELKRAPGKISACARAKAESRLWTAAAKLPPESAVFALRATRPLAKAKKFFTR